MMRARIWGMGVVLGALAALFCAGPAAAASGISGHVTDTANQPLQGIEVCAMVSPTIGGGAGCTWTDSNGDYSIPAAVAGETVHFHSIENRAPGYAPQWWPGVPFSDEAQPVAEADAGHLDATMGPGGSFEGRVFSQATDVPVEGVLVCPSPVVFRDAETGYCARSDAEGRYNLRGLSEAEYRFGLYTEGDVNYVETVIGPFAIHGPATGIVEDSLVPGFEIEGTVTEAGTGKPVGEAIPLPHSGTNVCAVDSVTEARVKCVGVGVDGRYSIPGIPPGKTVGVTFGVDNVEDGVDVGQDGYVRRYWDEVPNWSEAAFISGSGGSVFGGIDAVLTQGEEVFPHCEVASACAAPPPTKIVVPPPSVVETTSRGPNPYQAEDPPRLSTHPSALRCKTGFRRVSGVRDVQCVKIHKKGAPRKHRRPAHPRRHGSVHR